jgi:hypothetical protein
MSNKDERERKEMENLFKDPKFSRKAWQHVGIAIANSPASKPFTSYDKDGNPTLQSEIEQYSYTQLHKDIQSLGIEDRQPTELEMILKCQMIRARYDTSAAVFVRDTLGAKPVDESKLDAQATVKNAYENLTDEELEMLAAMRAKKAEDERDN